MSRRRPELPDRFSVSLTVVLKQIETALWRLDRRLPTLQGKAGVKGKNKEKLLAVDHLVRESMKSAASCVN